jgi:hypothetical protein
LIKVFLSHQSSDTLLAQQIARRLQQVHSIDSYLDVIDPYIGRPGEDLAAHIRAEMGKCTQLLAVVSDATKSSQWVPWEIGVASEKDYPLATYSSSSATPPEFLRKWPYLRSDYDLDRYATASKAARSTLVQKSRTLNESVARRSATSEFYQTLRSSLGQ